MTASHDSDCATHNMPAYSNGQCDCGASGLSDPDHIWLQNADDAKHQGEGRMWCEDKVWPDHPEDGEPTKYVRADLFDSLTARVKELEDHNRRLGQGGAERYWEGRYRDEAAALARAEQQRDEAYERAAKCAENLFADPNWNAMCQNAGNSIAAAIRRLASDDLSGVQ